MEIGKEQNESTILIVDDNPVIVRLLEALLTRASYVVETVSSGDEALEAMNKVKPDLVLLDDLEQKPELKLKIMAEIRGQLKLQLDIFQTLYDMRTVQEFQHEVLETIGSVNKEIRDEIIRRLHEKHALRSAFQIN